MIVRRHLSVLTGALKGFLKQGERTMNKQILDCFYCLLPTATMREHFGIRIALCDSCDRYVLRIVSQQIMGVRA